MSFRVTLSAVQPTLTWCVNVFPCVSVPMYIRVRPYVRPSLYIVVCASLCISLLDGDGKPGNRSKRKSILFGMRRRAVKKPEKEKEKTKHKVGCVRVRVVRNTFARQ
jgi:hypothetical protein